MFGVSPAYFISRFGDGFSCRDIADSLPDLRASGFEAFQPEVFHTANLDEWRTGGAALIKRAADATGMVASQFVGHFLLHAFESPEALASDFGIVEIEKALGGNATFSRVQGPDGRRCRPSVRQRRQTSPPQRMQASAHG